MNVFRCRRTRGRLLPASLALLVASAAGAAAQAPSLVLPPPQAAGAAFPAPPRPVQPPALPAGTIQALPPGTTAPPAAPVIATEVPNDLPGVPFPSMVQQGTRPVPLSNQPLPLDPSRTQSNMGQLERQVGERMQQLRTGAGVGQPAGGAAVPGGMTPPSIAGYAGELQELAQTQRNIRVLQARRQEAEAAMQLYNLLFDARREDEAARRQEREREDRSRTLSSADPSASPSAPQATASQAAFEAASRMELPLPRIVTVAGSGSALRATLLVPYIGEVKARPGTMLPGERRVTSVTADGVTISDPRLGQVSLGFGDSVPAAPPQRIPGLPGVPPQIPGMIPQPPQPPR